MGIRMRQRPFQRVCLLAIAFVAGAPAAWAAEQPPDSIARTSTVAAPDSNAFSTLLPVARPPDPRTVDPAAGTIARDSSAAGAAVAASSGRSSAARKAPSRSVRLEGASGFEFEGMDQSFGLETWLDPGGAGWPDEEQLESLRGRLRETELLGYASLLLRGADSGSWGPRLQADARWGSRRRSLTADGEFGWEAGPLRGLTLRDRMQFDRRSIEEVSATSSSGQNVLSFQWSPLHGKGLRPVARGEADISWSDDDLAQGDTLGALYAYFLDYRRFTAGIGMASEAGNSAFLDFVHKESQAGGGADHDAGILRLQHAAYSVRGFRHVEARCERRETPAMPDSLASFSSALRSYWEAALESSWQHRLGPFEWEGALDLTGTRFDSGASRDSLAAGFGWDADRLRIEGEWILGRTLFGGLPSVDDLLAGVAALDDTGPPELRAGAGFKGERLWLSEGAGEYASWGGKLELAIQGGRSLGGAWIEADVEAGRRNYLEEASSLVLDVGGLAYSFAQSDFLFLRLSLLASGRLPLGLEWEGYAFLEREDHETGENDARIGSVHLAVKRRWPLW